MKKYNAPTISTVELDFVDVIATSGEGEKGINTASYGFDSTGITNTDKGQAWQNSWNN